MNRAFEKRAQLCVLAPFERPSPALATVHWTRARPVRTGPPLATRIDRAKKIIDRLGIVLVYPIANKSEPPSLWSELWPKSPMEWSWDEDADPRVAELWHLRERLARS